MAKLTDFKDEQALDLLADILLPVSEIAQDELIRKVLNGEEVSKTVAEVVGSVIKGHKSAVMDILAALNGVPREEYHCNVLTLPMQIMEVINDKELMAFFHAQAQNNSMMTFGSAMDSTQDNGE